MGTIDKIEKLEERINKAFEKTIPGASANKKDRIKAQAQYEKLSNQLTKLMKKVSNSSRLIEQWECRYGCDFDL